MQLLIAEGFPSSASKQFGARGSVPEKIKAPHREPPVRSPAPGPYWGPCCVQKSLIVKGAVLDTLAYMDLTTVESGRGALGAIKSRATVAYHAQAPAVLDHSRTLPQGDGRTGPAFTRRALGCQRDLIVLDASDVLDNAFAVRRPGIDAEGEVSSKRRGHLSCSFAWPTISRLRRVISPNPPRPLVSRRVHPSSSF